MEQNAKPHVHYKSIVNAEWTHRYQDTPERDNHIIFTTSITPELHTVSLCYALGERRSLRLLTPVMAFVEHVHRFTLGTLHLMLQLRASLSLLLAYLWSTLLLPFKHKGDKLELISADARRLAKLPLHLALIVQEEEVWPEDLARLVAWAFAVGVRYVSLYDHSGGRGL